jgi:hypothetical protein
VQSVPVEFLSDQEAAAFGRYGDSVPLVAGQREDHNRLGFSVQIATVRYIGRFLADPLDGVLAEVIDFLAGQLQIADPSCLKRYSLRKPTHREHAGKIQERLGLKDFAEVEAELAVFAGRRAWVTGDGPKAIFADAVGWLRDRAVLLPGVSRLARLVARERDAATQRLWERLYAALTGQQRLALDGGAAGCAGVGAGAVAVRAGAGVGSADGQGAEPGRGDHRVGAVAGAAGRERDTAAAGRAGPVRDGCGRGPAEAAW